MAAPLFEHLDEILLQLRAAAARLALFLDFDGTLVPFASHPDDVQLSPPISRVLKAAASIPGVLVGIISGRELADVRDRVGLPELIYAGNHGLEIRGPGLEFRHPTAEAAREILRRISDELQVLLGSVAGVLVENKGLTASVHVRLVADHAREHVRRIVDGVVDSRADTFVRTDGQLVYEVRPRAEWNKGSAVRWILDRVAAASSRAVYIGDDRTDEDAFAALPGGITIKVGRSTTLARYQIAGCEDVLRFLQRWVDEAAAKQAAR